jgi:uncharacterized protein YhaN
VRVTGWHISGFGHFQDLRHSGLPGGLAVVYGPNEAGKSTLLAFLLFVLFGKERGRRVHALGGGRLGGRIELVLDGAAGSRKVTVERFEGEPPVVLDNGQRLVGEDAVARLLGGTDRRLFQSIYAFSLADLTSLDGLGDGATRERLFAGAVAGAGRSVDEARRGLARERDKLWRTRADCTLRTTSLALHAVQESLAEAQREAGQLATLRQAISQARIEPRLRDAAGVQANTHAVQALALVEAWPLVADAQQARAEIETLQTDAVLEPAQADELRTHLEAMARCEQEHTAARDALLGAEGRRDQIVVDLDLLEVGARIGTLAASLDGIRSDHETVERFAAHVPMRQADLNVALKRCGLESVAQLAAVDLAHARVVALRQAAQGLREAERTRGALQQAEVAVRRDEKDLADKAAVREAVALDPVAERHAPLVDRLLAEQAEVVADQARLEHRAQALVVATEEFEAAQRGLLPAPETPTGRLDTAGLIAVRAAVEPWRTAQSQATVERATHEAHLAAAHEAVTRAERAHALVQVPEAWLEASAAIQGLEARVGTARVAQAPARDAQEAADEAERDAERALERLGPGWSAGRAWSVQTGEAIRALGMRLADTLRRAEQRAEVLRDQLEPIDYTLLSREEALAHRDAVLGAMAAREDLDRARRNRPDASVGRGLPGSLPWSLVLGALVLLSCGVFVALRSAAIVGALVVLLALICAAIGLYLSRWAQAGQGGGAQAGDDVAHQTGIAARRLAAAGLPVDADSLALTTALQQAEAAVRTAERTELATRARRQCEQAQAAAVEARAEYVAWCARIGLPGDTAPDDLGVRLATVREACDSLQKASDLQQKAVKYQAEADAWVQDRDALATRLDVPLASGVLATLGRGLREAEEAQRQRHTRHAELATATRLWTEARTPVVDEGRQRALAAEQALRSLAQTVGVPEAVPTAGIPGWLDALERLAMARARREALTEEVDRLRQPIQRWRAGVATLRTDCGLEGTDAAVLEAARDRCDRALFARTSYEIADLSWRAAQSALALTQRDLAAAQGRIESVADAQARWLAARDASGLPGSVGPEALDTALALTEVAQKRAQDFAIDEAGGQAAERRVQTWVQAARDLGSQLSRAVPMYPTLAIEWVRTLESDRQGAETARQRQAIADGDVAERQAKLHAVAERLAWARSALDQALRAAGLRDPAAMRDAVARANRVAACRERIRLAATGVRALLGAAADDPLVQARLDTGDLSGWQAEAARARQQAEAARMARDEASAHLGRLQGDLARLESATDIPDLAAEQARLQAVRSADQHKLAVLSLADHLLGQTLVRFRERHAPGVFRVAGEHLRTATAGTYARVEATENYSDLVIHDAHQGTRSPDDLSRGTKDLLYFTLRLGLAREQQPGGQTLPLVLDDILVNLDPERAEGVCRVLAQEAAVRQVILLTCRPETVALLRAHVPEVAVVSLERFGGRSVPVTPPLKQERATRTARMAVERPKPTRPPSA